MACTFNVYYRRELLFTASVIAVTSYTGHSNDMTPAASEAVTSAVSNIWQRVASQLGVAQSRAFTSRCLALTFILYSLLPRDVPTYREANTRLPQPSRLVLVSEVPPCRNITRVEVGVHHLQMNCQRRQAANERPQVHTGPIGSAVRTLTFRGQQCSIRARSSFTDSIRRRRMD